MKTEERWSSRRSAKRPGKGGERMRVDEEAGRRAILNFSHTFGHAIERCQGYGDWLHGEAVGYGMLMALDFSLSLGLIDNAQRQRGAELIQAVGLPCSAPPELKGAEQMLELMAHDKKVVRGQLRLVLLRKLGKAFVSSDFPIEQLRESIQHSLGRQGI